MDHQIIINDREFTIKPMRGMIALRTSRAVWSAVARGVVPALVSAMLSAGAIESDEVRGEAFAHALGDIDSQALAASVSEAIDHLSDKIILDLLSGCFLGDKQLSREGYFEEVFEGRMFDLVRLLMEVVKVNGMLPMLAG